MPCEMRQLATYLRHIGLFRHQIPLCYHLLSQQNISNGILSLTYAFSNFYTQTFVFCRKFRSLLSAASRRDLNLNIHAIFAAKSRSDVLPHECVAGCVDERVQANVEEE